jgi:DNA-directed RNA polymerase subunit RPC12/RpoP
MKGKCPMCGHYVILVYLGTLGGVNWYRCRNCGTEVGFEEVNKK